MKENCNPILHNLKRIFLYVIELRVISAENIDEHALMVTVTPKKIASFDYVKDTRYRQAT
ncbi:MAG: hypothetical protein KGD60_05825 [Candidatus Thorarchaeota archaeon]|nr:hypothetical protein [Candidatus Thorarchaeota archaeon]